MSAIIPESGVVPGSPTHPLVERQANLTGAGLGRAPVPALGRQRDELVSSSRPRIPLTITCAGCSDVNPVDRPPRPKSDLRLALGTNPFAASPPPEPAQPRVESRATPRVQSPVVIWFGLERYPLCFFGCHENINNPVPVSVPPGASHDHDDDASNNQGCRLFE